MEDVTAHRSADMSFRGQIGGQLRGSFREHSRGKEPVVGHGLVQQCFDFAAQRVVVRTGGCQQGAALVGRQAFAALYSVSIRVQRSNVTRSRTPPF